jgi:hypothetical protein
LATLLRTPQIFRVLKIVGTCGAPQPLRLAVLRVFRAIVCLRGIKFAANIMALMASVQEVFLGPGASLKPGSLSRLPKRDQLPYSAWQIGPSVSHSFHEAA